MCARAVMICMYVCAFVFFLGGGQGVLTITPTYVRELGTDLAERPQLRGLFARELVS